MEPQDYQWFNSLKNDYYEIHDCMNKCKQAYNNHDMNALSYWGNRMFHYCEDAKNRTSGMNVSGQFSQMKNDCDNWLYHCGQAGYYFSNGDVNDGVSEANAASNAISPQEDAAFTSQFNQVPGVPLPPNI